MRRVAAVIMLGLVVGIIGGCGGGKVWVEKYDNGKTKVEYQYYTDDSGGRVYDGYYREYFEGGNAKIEDHFEDGERDGKRIEYYENGKVRVEETFKGGKRVGKRIEYNEDGKVEFERTFINGKCISGC